MASAPSRAMVAHADVPESSPTRLLSETLAYLMQAPLPVARSEWRRWHSGLQIPKRLPRDLIVRSVAWQMQAKERGGLAPLMVRQLDALAAQLATSGDLNMEREVRLKPGTRLVREWRGRIYRVEVLGDGYVMDERRYASLSHVARAITGTRWSGPRFFGLKQRERRSSREAR